MELRLCKDFGIPHSEWLEWDPEDRAKAIAFNIEEGLRCSMCGTADWEWKEDKYAYKPVEKICEGCEKKDIILKGDENKGRPGRFVVLEPRSK